MADHVMTFDGDVVRCIYDDALLPALAALGPVTVTRASHVEPAPGGGWLADMSPSGAQVILAAPDGTPFATRQAALDAEVAWLRRERGL